MFFLTRHLQQAQRAGAENKILIILFLLFVNFFSIKDNALVLRIEEEGILIFFYFVVRHVQAARHVQEAQRAGIENWRKAHTLILP
jgi:hypothetical protein